MLYAASRIPMLTMDGLFQLLPKSARFSSTLIAIKWHMLHEAHGRLNWAPSSPQQVPAQRKQNKLHCKLYRFHCLSLANTTEMTQSEWQYDCALKMTKKWPHLTCWPDPTRPNPTRGSTRPVSNWVARRCTVVAAASQSHRSRNLWTTL